MKYISSLQYITQGANLAEIEREVRAVLTGGCDWIQLRMKGSSDREFTTVAKRIKELCFSFNATLIINDNPFVAIESKADGVHLGKGDMPTSTLRELVGKGMIVGRTANTVRDIELLSKQRIDYIGLGPYKYTTTKENISDILGLDGYRSLFDELKRLGVTPPPIVAIGGIVREDIELLASVKELSGIAVSGALAKSNNIIHTTMDFIAAVEKYFKIENYNI